MSVDQIIGAGSHLVVYPGNTLDISNSKTLTVLNGSTFEINGIFNWDKGTFVNNTGAVLSGTGLINLNGNTPLALDGIIAPGNSIGTLTVTGGITFANTSSLNIEINGTSGVNDLLSLSGAATFDGTLNVTISGGTIDAGDTYTIVSYGSHTGTFPTVNLPGNPLDWTISYGATALNIIYNGGTALPVTWRAFTATLEGDDVQLDWSTGSESYNAGFYVQRSENGRDWETLNPGDEIIPGTNTSFTQNYSYTDNTLSTLNSQLAYYRIEQRDFDGATDYSSVRVVQLPAQGGIRLFPNPASEEVTVAFTEPIETRGLIQLYTQNRRFITEYPLSPQTQEFSFRVTQLPAGTYIVVVKAGAHEWTRRLVVE